MKVYEILKLMEETSLVLKNGIFYNPKEKCFLRKDGKKVLAKVKSNYCIEFSSSDGNIYTVNCKDY